MGGGGGGGAWEAGVWNEAIAEGGWGMRLAKKLPHRGVCRRNTCTLRVIVYSNNSD